MVCALQCVKVGFWQTTAAYSLLNGLDWYLVYGFAFWQLFIAADKLLVVDVASTNRLIFLGLEIYIRPVYFGVRYRLDEIILFRNLSDLCCTVYFHMMHWIPATPEYSDTKNYVQQGSTYIF